MEKQHVIQVTSSDWFIHEALPPNKWSRRTIHVARTYAQILGSQAESETSWRGTHWNERKTTEGPKLNILHSMASQKMSRNHWATRQTPAEKVILPRKVFNMLMRNGIHTKWKFREYQRLTLIEHTFGDTDSQARHPFWHEKRLHALET